MSSAYATPPAASRLAKVAAGLAVATAAVHLVLLRSSGSTQALVMAAMALACLPCAWHLWRRATGRVWAITAGVDAAMAVLHLRMLAQPAGAEPSDMAGTGGMGGMGGMAGMHVHDSGAPAVSSGGQLMWLALVLVAVQLAVAGAAALHRYVPNQKWPVHAGPAAVTQR